MAIGSPRFPYLIETAIMKIVICEDEPPISVLIEKYLVELFPSNATIFKAHSVDAAIATINKESVDLLLLDLNLSGEDGFHILKEFLARDFQTIVISAHRERALEAFEFGVFDFIVKLFSKNRISQAINRLLSPKRENTGTSSIICSSHKELRAVPLRDVLYVQAIGHYTKIFMSNGHFEICRKSIKTLLMILPNDFVQVHKSYIIRKSAVTKIITRSGGYYSLIISNGTSIPLSRKLAGSVVKEFKRGR